jgi:hypothetical protein
MIISSKWGWFFKSGANSGRTSQLILASGKFLRRADNVGNARTMSPSELGLIIKIFFGFSGIIKEF